MVESTNQCVVYWHPQCQLDNNQTEHDENSQRALFISKKLKSKKHSATYRESRVATDQEIGLFHTQKMISSFYIQCIRAKATGKQLKLDDDTYITGETYDAVYHAVGAVLHAIDDAFLPTNHPNHINTAFCNVRPPGHHAFPDCSSGFCFFNNVGVGAKYAMSKYGVERVAILDFDAHHGNGTEQGFIGDDSIFYASTHAFSEYPFPDDCDPFTERLIEKHGGRIVKQHIDAKCNNKMFCNTWKIILKKMISFKPQLILLSAGI
jgi:acetoin utilization deacetylase AcuC-like enzyme